MRSLIATQRTRQLVKWKGHWPYSRKSVGSETRQVDELQGNSMCNIFTVYVPCQIQDLRSMQCINGFMNNTIVSAINGRHVQRQIQNYKELRVLLWKPGETDDRLACFFYWFIHG